MKEKAKVLMRGMGTLAFLIIWGEGLRGAAGTFLYAHANLGLGSA